MKNKYIIKVDFFMDEKKKKNTSHDGFQDSVIGAVSTEFIGRYGHAAAEYIKGYRGEVSETGDIVRKGLRQVADSKVNPDYRYQNIKQQSGFSAEIHYVDQENAERIINGDNSRIFRSNDIGRGNDPVFDVLSIDEQGNPSWGAQMKFCGRFDTPEEIQASAKHIVDKLAGSKWERYRGNDVLIPEEQYAGAKAYAEATSRKCAEQAKKFRSQGNIEKAELLEQQSDIYKQISLDLKNSHITSREAIFLREHPKLATAKYVAQTAHKAGMESAKSAAVISGSISVAQNITDVILHDKDIGDAAIDVSKDVVAGSATAYLIGNGDTMIRGMMSASKNNVFNNLSQSNVPALISTTVVQVGKSLIRYANGEIDTLGLIEELGEKGTGMMAASMGAAIGSAILPGIGTVVGSMLGYMTSSTIYNGCMKVLAQERFSAERRAKIHWIANAAIEAMRLQGNELLLLTEQFYGRQQRVFEQSLGKIETCIRSNDLDTFTLALNDIATEMGRTLKFKNFDEFDSFMSDPFTVLTI